MKTDNILSGALEVTKASLMPTEEIAQAIVEVFGPLGAHNIARAIEMNLHSDEV